jgi:hypothetical protein
VLKQLGDLLKWRPKGSNQTWIAEQGGVATIRRAELADNESMTAPNDLAVRRALEAAGVVFIDENGDGPGVRLRKRSNEKSRKRM